MWSVNKLARAVTKWTKSCDKRLARLISYIHHTCEYRQYCHVGNTAQRCRLGLVLCIFGSHTFVPTSYMCKKQTSVSHSSTEAEIISLDAVLRMDGIQALRTKQKDPRKRYRENRRQLSVQTCITPFQSSTPTSFQQTLITFHPIQRILTPVICCMSLRTMGR